MRIIENRYVPIESPVEREREVFKLRPRVPVSDAFRADMNRWLAETFGSRMELRAELEPTVYMVDGSVLGVSFDRMMEPWNAVPWAIPDVPALIMHPVTAAKMRAAIAAKHHG